MKKLNKKTISTKSTIQAYCYSCPNPSTFCPSYCAQNPGTAEAIANSGYGSVSHYTC